MIHLNPTAIQEIKRLQAKRAASNLAFRLQVQPGGCADWYYHLELTDNPNPDEQSFNCQGISVLIDSQSLPYVTGLTLDYTEDLMGGGFRFHNPHALQTCGCGNSFSINPSTPNS